MHKNIKPNDKYAIKVSKLCTGNGYAVRVKIYAGKNLNVSKLTPTDIVMVCIPTFQYVHPI